MSIVERMSTHAIVRGQQRGIPMDIIELVTSVGDRIIEVGDGSSAISISEEHLKVLRADGVSAQLLDKAKNVVVVQGSEDSKAVTVMRSLGSKGRPYRQQYRNGWPRIRDTQSYRYRA